MGRSNTYRLANPVITAVTLITSVAIRTTWELRMGFTSGEGDSEHRQSVAPGRDSCAERNQRRMTRDRPGARITNTPLQLRPGTRLQFPGRSTAQTRIGIYEQAYTHP